MNLLKTISLTTLYCLLTCVTAAATDDSQSETVKDNRTRQPVVDTGGSGPISEASTVVDRDRGSSVTTLTGNSILRLPLRSIEEVIAFQNGVVVDRSKSATPRLHIRGGGAELSGCYLNGVNITDQFTGMVSATVSPHAVQSFGFHPGSFSSEYGNAGSGIINLLTSSGTAKYSGMVEILSDNVGGSAYDQNWYTGRLSGPLPLLNKGSFSGVVERRWFGDRRPSAILDMAMPGNWLDGWSYHGRADYDFREDISLTVTADGSENEWSQYLNRYLFNIEHTPYYHDKSQSLSGRLEHTVSPKLNYSLGVARFESERFRGDGLYREDLWGYARPAGNPQTDRTALFMSWDDPTTPVTTTTRTVPTDTMTMVDSVSGGNEFTSLHTTDSLQMDFVTTGNEAHVFDSYIKHKSSYVALNGRVTGKFIERHTFSAGFDYLKHTVRYYNHLIPQFVSRGVGFGGFQDVNRYGYDDFGNESDGSSWRDEPNSPTDLALHFQSRVEFEHMIVTAGVRMDRFDYNGWLFRNPRLPMDPDSLIYDTISTNNDGGWTLDGSDLIESPVHTVWSPRLAVALPVNDLLQFHVNYGTYYQRAPFQYLYAGWDFVQYHLGGLPGYFTAWGNSDLRPMKATSYEVGLSLRKDNYITANISLFHREETDLLELATVPSTPVSFTTYFNRRQATSKGLDLRVQSNPVPWMNLDLRYTHSEGEYTGSLYGGNVAWVNGQPPLERVAMDNDQRHKLVGIFDFRFGEEQGFKMGSGNPVENFNLSILATAASGLPYTQASITNEAVAWAVAPSPIKPRNSDRRPWSVSIDLKLEKMFSVSGFKLAPFLLVKNLLDKDNVVDVWSGSGEPNSTGWLATPEGQTFIAQNATPHDNSGLTGEQKYRIAETNPQNYANPRQVYFGLRAAF